MKLVYLCTSHVKAIDIRYLENPNLSMLVSISREYKFLAGGETDRELEKMKFHYHRRRKFPKNDRRRKIRF